MQLSIYYSTTSVVVRIIRYVVGTSGLEPPTSRLSGVCSNQLSYVPINFNLLLVCLYSSVKITPPKWFGGGKRDRTADPLLARQVLSQLSYTPILSRNLDRK